MRRDLPDFGTGCALAQPLGIERRGFLRGIKRSLARQDQPDQNQKQRPLSHWPSHLGGAPTTRMPFDGRF